MLWRLCLWQDLALLEWGVLAGAETNPYSKEMNGVINLPPAPVGMLRQIWLWCCTAPWDAGQGELAKFLPALRSHGSPCQSRGLAG